MKQPLISDSPTGSSSTDGKRVTRRPQQDLSGQVLDQRFSLVEVIGSGGTGVVYRALDQELEREVAVKVLDLGFDPSQDPAYKTRFHNEAALTARLAHPNIITVFGRGETATGLQYIAMELLKGRSLQETLSGGTPLPWERGVTIATQLCRGLREAHTLGLVHRDLKPANIFLIDQFDSELVKVLDFGLAKPFVSAQTEQELAQVVLGSPTYMAPEQARNQTSPQSDIYSLGVVLFVMLTGRVPFSAKTPIDVIVQHLRAPVPWFRDVSQVSVPRELELVVRRCLEKDPRDRYSSMAALLDAVKQASGAPVHTGVFPVPAEALRPMATPIELPQSAKPPEAPMQTRVATPLVVVETSAPLPPEELTVPAPDPLDVAFRPWTDEADAKPAPHLSPPVPSWAPVITGELMVPDELTRPYPEAMQVPLEAKSPAAVAAAAMFSNLKQPPSRRPWVFGAAGAGLLALGLGLALWRPTPAATQPSAPAQEKPAEPTHAMEPAKPPAPVAPESKLVRFRVSSIPAGATLKVDGKVVGTTPTSFEQLPDDDGVAVASITLELTGYQTLSFETGGSGPEVVMVQRMHKGRGPARRKDTDDGPELVGSADAVTPALAVEPPAPEVAPAIEPPPPAPEPVAAPTPPPVPRGPVPLTDAMKRPEMLDVGTLPAYSRQAMTARAEGTAIAKCVVTLAGTLERCRIIKSVPFMDEAVLTSLASRRYRPAELDGQAVETEIVVAMKLSLK